MPHSSENPWPAEPVSLTEDGREYEYTGRMFQISRVNVIREFAVDRYYRLVGPHAGGFVFRPGVNHAACGTGWKSREQQVAHQSKGSEDDFDRCSHGFYGYYDADRDRMFSGSGNFCGILAAEGKVDVGTNGVRAQRGTVEALVVPYGFGRQIRHVWDHRVGRLLLAELGLGAIAACGITALSTTPNPNNPPLYVALSFVAAIVAAIVGAIFFGVCLFTASEDTSSTWNAFKPMPWSYRGRILVPFFAPSDHRKRLKQNYPDLRIYKSTRKMLADFPVIDPDGRVTGVRTKRHEPVLTANTADDFWDL